MAKMFLCILVLLGVGMALLCINILLRKNGTFRSEDVGKNKAMRERGIHCTQAQDKIAQRTPNTFKEMSR